MTSFDRRRLYALLAKIYSGTFNPTDAEEAAGLDDVVGHIPSIPEDDRAADHEALFGLNVLPFASVFLEENGMLGGSVTARMSSFRHQAGLRPDGRHPSDHIASEMELLATLTDTGDARNQEGNELLCRVIDTHMLSWLPALVRAIGAETQTYYRPIATTTLNVMIEQRLLFGPQSSENLPPLPPVPGVLEDASAGLAEIARFFTTPVWSGVYFSRAGIGRMSRGRRLPHGFGGRAQMMATLLRSAVAYDGLDHVVQQVETEITESRTTWERVARVDLEAAHHWSEQWLQRLEQTRSMLRVLIAAVREEN